MKQFKFKFPLFDNGVKKIPLQYYVDQEGVQSGIKELLEAVVGIPITKTNLTSNQEIEVRFGAVLSQQQIDDMNAAVTYFKDKTGFSPIEEIAMLWGAAKNSNEDKQVLSVLPIIEQQLSTIYNPSNWNGYNFAEKRILARWFICDDTKCLEVYSQDELNSFRYFKLYRGLSETIRAGLTWEDVKKPPFSYDFTRLFQDQFYKRLEDKVKGRPTLKEYYFAYNPVTFEYSDIFAKLTWEFFDDTSFLVLNKSMWLSWYYNDGTIDETIRKNIGRNYNPTLLSDNIERIEEGKKRRRNVYSDILAQIVGLVAQLDPTITSQDPVQQFIEAENKASLVLPILKVDFEIWIDVGSSHYNTLIVAINGLDTATHDWLLIEIPNTAGVTIMQYVISLIPNNNL